MWRFIYQHGIQAINVGKLQKTFQRKQKELQREQCFGGIGGPGDESRSYDLQKRPNALLE